MHGYMEITQRHRVEFSIRIPGYIWSLYNFGDAMIDEGKNPGSRQYPRYVRILAVAYVLSLAVGPVGFFVLLSVAAFLKVRYGTVDAKVLGFALGAVGCPVFCAMFRTWFRNWGRRNWPAPESE